MNLTLISAAVAAALGFGAAWQIQGHFLTNQELTHANERIGLQRAARAQIEGHMQRVSQAQEASQTRMVALRHDAAGAKSELDGLRTQSADSLRAAGESLDACNATAATFSVISNQCSERYSALARDAQGHVIDKQTLMDGWPR